MSLKEQRALAGIEEGTSKLHRTIEHMIKMIHDTDRMARGSEEKIDGAMYNRMLHASDLVADMALGLSVGQKYRKVRS